MLSLLSPLLVLMGGMMLVADAFAQGERLPRFHDMPPNDRRQSKEQFRPERPPNSERLNQRREEMRSRAIERARQADTNHDGGLSRQETERSMPHLSRHFDEIDTNHDGVVTREEVRTFRERRMRQRLERGRGF